MLVCHLRECGDPSSVLNSKSEARNPKQKQNIKFKILNKHNIDILYIIGII